MPVIERFESDSEGFGVEGGEATLSWTVVGADTIQIDSGVGLVDGSEATVSVTETTAFTLTATNAPGRTHEGPMARY